jgi:microcystin-dependent protein
MPRNSSGVYTLPAGNPVAGDTTIDTEWANPTMSDIGNEITNSLPRDGSAGMTGPLMLARQAISPMEAVPLSQIESVLSGESNYVPAGVVLYMAGNYLNDSITNPPPAGWLVCDGSSRSTTTFADLFAAIGYTYGGSGSNFNLPDLRGMFVRGYDSTNSVDPGRSFGSVQADTNKSHTHGVVDNGHQHDQGTLDISAHAITDPGHAHNITASASAAQGGSSHTDLAPSGVTTTTSVKANITIADHTITGLTSKNAADVTVSADGGTESRPKNVAMTPVIRTYGSFITGQLGTMALQSANNVQITGGNGAFTTLSCATAPVAANDVVRLGDLSTTGVQSIVSGDPATLNVNSAIPSTPILTPVVNQANGLVKLDGGGKININFMPYTAFNYRGSWDIPTEGNLNPSEKYPSITWTDGDLFQIYAAGNMNVINSSGVSQNLACAVGGTIVYNKDPEVVGWQVGWYYNPPAAGGGSGGVTGPATSVVGHVATWGDALGGSLVDSGVVPFVGPANATNNTIPRFSGTDGKTVKNSGVTISDTDVVTALGFVGPLTGNATSATSATSASTASACSGNAATATLAADSSKLGNVVAASYARKDTANLWTLPQATDFVAANSGAINLALKNDFTIDVTTTDILITFSNLTIGQRGMIALNNPNGRNITFAASPTVKKPANTVTDLAIPGYRELAYWVVNATTILLTYSDLLA